MNSLPNASAAAETLVEAASSSNFSLSVNTSSISATGKLDWLFPAFWHFYYSHIKYIWTDNNFNVIVCDSNVIQVEVLNFNFQLLRHQLKPLPQLYLQLLCQVRKRRKRHFPLFLFVLLQSLITVFPNRLNMFPLTIAQFLKTLDTKLTTVSHFLKTPLISLKMKNFT